MENKQNTNTNQGFDSLSKQQAQVLSGIPQNQNTTSPVMPASAQATPLKQGNSEQANAQNTNKPDLERLQELLGTATKKGDGNEGTSGLKLNNTDKPNDANEQEDSKSTTSESYPDASENSDRPNAKSARPTPESNKNDKEKLKAIEQKLQRVNQNMHSLQSLHQVSAGIIPSDKSAGIDIPGKVLSLFGKSFKLQPDEQVTYKWEGKTYKHSLAQMLAQEPGSDKYFFEKLPTQQQTAFINAAQAVKRKYQAISAAIGIGIVAFGALAAILPIVGIPIVGMILGGILGSITVGAITANIYKYINNRKHSKKLEPYSKRIAQLQAEKSGLQRNKESLTSELMGHYSDHIPIAKRVQQNTQSRPQKGTESAVESDTAPAVKLLEPVNNIENQHNFYQDLNSYTSPNPLGNITNQNEHTAAKPIAESLSDEYEASSLTQPYTATLTEGNIEQHNLSYQPQEQEGIIENNSGIYQWMQNIPGTLTEGNIEQHNLSYQPQEQEGIIENNSGIYQWMQNIPGKHDQQPTTPTSLQARQDELVEIEKDIKDLEQRQTVQLVTPKDQLLSTDSGYDSNHRTHKSDNHQQPTTPTSLQARQDELVEIEKDIKDLEQRQQATRHKHSIAERKRKASRGEVVGQSLHTRLRNNPEMQIPDTSLAFR